MVIGDMAPARLPLDDPTWIEAVNKTSWTRLVYIHSPSILYWALRSTNRPRFVAESGLVILGFVLFRWMRLVVHDDREKRFVDASCNFFPTNRNLAAIDPLGSILQRHHYRSMWLETWRLLLPCQIHCQGRTRRLGCQCHHGLLLV
jgi:hypothetical protein